MKAKVIKTGDVVDVKQAKAGSSYFLDAYNNPWKADDLDFDVPTESDELQNGIEIEFREIPDQQMPMFNDFMAEMKDATEKRIDMERDIFYRQLSSELLLELINARKVKETFWQDLGLLAETTWSVVNKMRQLENESKHGN